jgi:hypothetical protein
VTNREEFVVDDDDLAREEQTRNCRLILGVLADDAVSFQTTSPMAAATTSRALWWKPPSGSFEPLAGLDR